MAQMAEENWLMGCSPAGNLATMSTTWEGSEARETHSLGPVSFRVTKRSCNALADGLDLVGRGELSGKEQPEHTLNKGLVSAVEVGEFLRNCQWVMHIPCETRTSDTSKRSWPR